MASQSIFLDQVQEVIASILGVEIQKGKSGDARLVRSVVPLKAFEVLVTDP